MKTILIFLFAVMTAVGYGQTPFSVAATSKNPEVGLASASVNNTWIGAKLSGTFGSGDLSENIILNGKVIYDLALGKIRLPVVSNVNIDFSDPNGTGFIWGDKGISIGVYPYKVISESGKTTWVLHGGLAYKLLPQETFKLTPQQTRIFAGVELAYNVNDDGYPFTLSVTPLYAINNLTATNSFAIETTAVLPVTGGLGVLAELTTPFKKGSDAAIFKLGAIVNLKL